MELSVFLCPRLWCYDCSSVDEWHTRYLCTVCEFWLKAKIALWRNGIPTQVEDPLYLVYSQYGALQMRPCSPVASLWEETNELVLTSREDVELGFAACLRGDRGQCWGDRGGETLQRHFEVDLSAQKNCMWQMKTFDWEGYISCTLLHFAILQSNDSESVWLVVRTQLLNEGLVPLCSQCSWLVNETIWNCPCAATIQHLRKILYQVTHRLGELSASGESFLVSCCTMENCLMGRWTSALCLLKDRQGKQVLLFHSYIWKTRQRSFAL